MSLSAKQKIVSISLFILIGVCLGACSTFSFKPAEEVLQSRVDGLMNARINSEWGKAYEFYSPSYKEEVSRDQFLSKSRKSHVIKYAIESIEISPSGEEAKVKIKRDMSAMMYDFPGIVTTQTWVKEGWDWYLQVDNKSERPF